MQLLRQSKRLAIKLHDEMMGAYGLGFYLLHRNEIVSLAAKKCRMITIELTNICNARCTFCGYQYQERKRGIMNFELYRNLIDQYSEMGGGHLGLTPTVGEPLLVPDLVERIRYARSKPNIWSIGMYSNMILVEKVGAKELVESGLNSLTASTAGFKEKMYERIYRSKEYGKMYSGIIKFCQENKRYGNPVDFQIALRPDIPLHSLQKEKDYQNILQYVPESRIGANYYYDNWSGKIKQSNLTGNMQLRFIRTIRQLHISPCKELFGGLYVYWDGKVGLCACRDLDAKYLVVGDISKNTLEEIWMSGRVASIRREFMTKKRNRLCISCSHYNNLSMLPGDLKCLQRWAG
jgi:MoaA/NifB/PqqE/SkfB family radical SAM enzyme